MASEQQERGEGDEFVLPGVKVELITVDEIQTQEIFVLCRKLHRIEPPFERMLKFCHAIVRDILSFDQGFGVCVYGAISSNLIRAREAIEIRISHALDDFKRLILVQFVMKTVRIRHFCKRVLEGSQY